MVVTVGLRPAWSKAGTRWSHELIGYALDLFHRRHLRTPTVDELRAGVPGLPSHPTIRRLYGNVTAMYTAHGYGTRSPGGQAGHTCSVLRNERGRFLARDGDSHSSTAAAHRRPSAIAHTISD